MAPASRYKGVPMYSTVDELLADKATLDKIDGVIICTGHSVRTLTLALTLTLASTLTLNLTLTLALTRCTPRWGSSSSSSASTSWLGLG